jgi:hypothetical protein
MGSLNNWPKEEVLFGEVEEVLELLGRRDNGLRARRCMRMESSADEPAVGPSLACSTNTCISLPVSSRDILLVTALWLRPA